VHYHERAIASREREDRGVRANSSVEKRERKSERVGKRSLNKCCRRQTDTQRQFLSTMGGHSHHHEEQEEDLFPVVTKQVRAACRYSTSANDNNNSNENQLLISASNIDELVSSDEKFLILKRTLKHSDERVLKHSHDLMFETYLRDKRNIETRMKTCGIIRKLSVQSKLFRELTMERLNEFLRFGLGVGTCGRNGSKRSAMLSESNLPGNDKAKKETLRQIGYETLEKWGVKFGAQFPQIEIAKRFVTENLGDEAPEVKAKKAKEEEARREREVQERLLHKWEEVKNDVPSLVEDSHEVVFGARACFEILFSAPAGKGNNKLENEEDDEEIEWEDVEDDEQTKLDGEKNDASASKEKEENNDNNDSGVYLCETEDNSAVLEDLRGFYVSARLQLLPKFSSHLAFLGRFTNHSLQDERARCINKLGEVKKKIVDIIERCDALNLIPLEKRKKLKQVAGNENDGEEEEDNKDEEIPIVQSGLMPSLQGENALRRSSNINELLERAHQRRRRAYRPPPKRQNASALAVKRAAKTVVAQQVRDHNEEMLAIAGTRAELGICEENAEQILEQERLATQLQDEEVREYKETKKRKKGSVKDRITQKLRMLKRTNRAGGR
jgi:hypothetical protein